MAGGSVINFPIDTFITANVLNYNEVKLNLRNKYCSAFQFQFGSNLVNYLVKAQDKSKLIY